jgi:ferritin-like metal-binding protein YciE
MASWFSKMLGTEMTLDNLDKLLEMQLQDLYSAEKQLISALPKMADAATSSTLKNAFRAHLRETKQHKARLERAFRLLGKKAKDEKCDAMKGLITEGEEVMKLDGDADVKDAALIAAAQRVEHYEIAGYGCVRAFAQRLNRADVANLLEQTLKEEGAADKKLTQIAEKSINDHAARASRRGEKTSKASRNGHAVVKSATGKSISRRRGSRRRSLARS